MGKEVRPKLLLCDKLYRLRLTDKLKTAYIEKVLSSNIVRFQLERATSGASSSMQNISQKVVGDLIIPLPPIGEQREIARHLKEELGEIDRLTKRQRALVGKLQELRTSLISEVVTGKIDVRDDVPQPAEVAA